MNTKGVSLVELLIVIVIMGIISAFSIVSVGEILENTRQNSFVHSANTFLDTAEMSYFQNDSIWDDNIVTLAEIIAAGYITIGNDDPWSGDYDFSESYIIVDTSLVPPSTIHTITFKIKLISTTAVLGYNEPLTYFTKGDIVFLDGSGGSLYDKIISVFDNSLTDNLTTDNGNDEINVTNDITSNSIIKTLDGDDSITVGDDIRNVSSVDMGAGNDTLTIGDDVRNNSTIDMGTGDDTLIMNGEIKGGSTIDTGEGNDTVIIKDDIQGNATVSTGEGDDTVTVNDDLQDGGLLDTGSGNDTVTIGDDLDDGTIVTGSGDDTLDVDTIKNNSTISTGEDNDNLLITNIAKSYIGQVTLDEGNDTLTIYDNTDRSKDFKTTIGTFDGGAGYDTLYLPFVSTAQWDEYVSDLFSNFETVILEDGTIML